jgi:hypothetical protein
VAAIWLRDIAIEKGHRTFTGDEVTGFSAVIKECYRMIDEYLASCDAKPVQQIVDGRRQEDIERRRLGLMRR